MPSEIRKSMEWKQVPAPSDSLSSRFVKVWEDKHGHTYYYDAVGDWFWHEHVVPLHQHFDSKATVNKTGTYWLRSNTGFGR